jgi:hypothetical protein
MSVSQHPVALQLEQRVGGAARLLATVMTLPLIDGIFVALILAGTLNTTVGMLETGLLIFGGSATLAVILAEMDGSPREMILSILLIGAVIVPLAALQAVFALTIESVLNMVIFERFAGLVILAIAAKTASSKIGKLLPSPGIIIALGLVASLQPTGLTVDLLVDPELIARAAATAGIGVAFALLVALTAPQLRGNVDLDRFRFGSSVALGVLALPILGLLETDAPIALAVLIVAALLAYDPDADPTDADDLIDDHGGSSESPTARSRIPETATRAETAETMTTETDVGPAPASAAAGTASYAGSPTGQPSADGAVQATEAATETKVEPKTETEDEVSEPGVPTVEGPTESDLESDEITVAGGDVGYGYPSEDSSRAPWL